jgi:hypothetical protein
MQRLGNPFPLWLDQHGDLIDAGYIYVGTANADPEVSPISVYWDSALTIPAPQPLRTRGGVIVNNGQPALVFIPDVDYSLRTRDADGNQVSYVQSASATGGVSYQPLDSDLTAIAALATTSYGRSLLTAANAAGGRSLLGIVSSLALTGGTVTGNILRSGAGPHLYHATGSFTSGRVFATVNTASDPTSQAGDIWIKYAP